MSSTPADGLNAATAAVLRGERAVAGMTIEELSERSGVPKVSVQRFLAGRRAINLDVLEALCAGLRLAPEDVLVQARERQRKADPELVSRVMAGMSRVTPPDVAVGVTSVSESS
jgi:transcriptional regulator with XRE-family HTH domain